MSPEYAIEGAFSVKSDVYSFGVLMIEIVSGKKSRFFNHPGHNLNLMGHVSTNLTLISWQCLYITGLNVNKTMENLLV